MEITRRRALPGGRAVLGGVLMAVAAVGVFLAYEQAGREPTDSIVVAARPIRLGEVIEASDLRTVHGQLPGGAPGFARVELLVGHVALGPISEGEIVQPGAVTDEGAAEPVHEVAITLPGRQIAVGRLKPGERVDVFVTYDDRTRSVVRGAQVVQIDAEDSASLTSDREISLVVAVPSDQTVAALVHALRTGDVTVVRSTFAEASTDDQLLYEGDASSTASSPEAG
ncbi:MAG: SAF domain-containing protein [Acidimicrobiales bacterium]